VREVTCKERALQKVKQEAEEKPHAEYNISASRNRRKPSSAIDKDFIP
jgi:hypothetical protein